LHSISQQPTTNDELISKKITQIGKKENIPFKNPRREEDACFSGFESVNGENVP